jgi:hypothetical protein
MILRSVTERPPASLGQPISSRLPHRNNECVSRLQGSYYGVEQLSTSRGKLNALSEFVRRGSALVLLDGFQADTEQATNSFLPLLSALLGSDPRCKAAGVASSMVLRKRTTAEAFIDLGSTIEVRQFTGGRLYGQPVRRARAEAWVGTRVGTRVVLAVTRVTSGALPHSSGSSGVGLRLCVCIWVWVWVWLWLWVWIWVWGLGRVAGGASGFFDGPCVAVMFCTVCGRGMGWPE